MRGRQGGGGWPGLKLYIVYKVSFYLGAQGGLGFWLEAQAPTPRLRIPNPNPNPNPNPIPNPNPNPEPQPSVP